MVLKGLCSNASQKQFLIYITYIQIQVKYVKKSSQPAHIAPLQNPLFLSKYDPLHPFSPLGTLAQTASLCLRHFQILD